jgi:hypothetical protein
MRRLILELAEHEISQVGIAIPPFQKIKSLELIHFLRQDSEEFAAIWRVELKTPSLNAKDLPLAGLVSEVQILEQEKSGAYTVFVRGGPILSSLLVSFGVTEGYLFPPIAIRGGKIKICFLGSSRQISDFLEKLALHGIHYRVVLLAEANFGPDSPLNQLTKGKGRFNHRLPPRLLRHPRKANSNQLAEKLKIANSTLVEHLRKAERRLIVQALTGGTDFWFDEAPKEK